MAIRAIEESKTARKAGVIMGRRGMSERVIDILESFDGSYVGAIRIAGQMKAIAQAAKCDQYWDEKCGMGYDSEMDRMGNIVANNDKLLEP